MANGTTYRNDQCIISRHTIFDCYGLILTCGKNLRKELSTCEGGQEWSDGFNEYLVCLFAMLMLRLSLKSICTIHILCFMIPSIYIKSLRMQPCARGDQMMATQVIMMYLHL